MSKKIKKVLLGAMVCVVALVGTGCSSNSDEPASMTIRSNSDKRFNKIVLEIDGEEEVLENMDGGDEFTKNHIISIPIPQKDKIKVNVKLKQKGKTIASSEDFEVKLKNGVHYQLLINDVSKDEVELGVEKFK